MRVPVAKLPAGGVKVSDVTAAVFSQAPEFSVRTLLAPVPSCKPSKLRVVMYLFVFEKSKMSKTNGAKLLAIPSEGMVCPTRNTVIPVFP